VGRGGGHKKLLEKLLWKEGRLAGFLLAIASACPQVKAVVGSSMSDGDPRHMNADVVPFFPYRAPPMTVHGHSFRESGEEGHKGVKEPSW
jgi:hypothetical protein